jgi:hypothetical protein
MAKLPGVKAHRRIATSMLSFYGEGPDADLDGMPLTGTVRNRIQRKQNWSKQPGNGAQVKWL